MVPVYQTRFGLPKGNCTEAAIASVLEVPLDSILDLQSTPEEGHEWLRLLNEWLRPAHGLNLVMFGNNWELPYPECWCLIGGISPRGFRHFVVGYNGEIRHDPHPDGTGLQSVDSIAFFVPVDPAIVQ